VLYMLLLYSDPDVPFPEDGMARHFALADRVRGAGAYVTSEALGPATVAKTVRNAQGGIVTDGPFAETKETLGGFYMLDCKDIDEALEYAKQIPSPHVEVRPVAFVPDWQYDVAPKGGRIPMTW